jgi:hypothetical protein
MITILLAALTMRVCYGKDCSTVPDADFACAQARNGQAFAVVRPAAHEIDIGVCGASDPMVWRSIDWIVTRPRDLTTAHVAIDNRWSFAIEPGELTQIQRIRAPAGPLRLTIRATHYRDASADLNRDRLTLVLRRNPVIRGRLLSASGQPLSNANVQPAPGDAPCATRPDGTFQCEIEREWPRTITVTHSAAPTRVIAINRLERDTDLGDIQLARGAQLSVHLTAPEGIRSVDVMLLRGDAPVSERKVVLPLSEPISFSNIEPGTVRLLMKGSHPFQQRAADVSIKDGDNDEMVSIEESELTLHVDSGGRPEPGASIVLKNLDGRWSGTSATDESGSVIEPIWQLGTFTASVQAKNSASPMLDRREFSGGGKQQWTFHLPIGRIEGIVRNDDNAAISNADVSLTTDDGDMTIALRTKADANGGYAFDGVRAGAQTVTAAADGYLPSDASQFRLVENENLRRVDLTLHRGVMTNVEVVDCRGVPLAGASIVAALGNAMIGRAISDSGGRASVQLSVSGSSVLFVVPASGSFAIHRVSAMDREQPSMRIAVPDPAASLELKTETTEHQPVRDVHFLVRYDGETIPFDLLMELAQRFGVDFKTGAAGSGTVANLPAGLYELWPYSNAADVQAVMAGVEAPAPLRIAVTPGPNSVTLTFRTKRR